MPAGGARQFLDFRLVDGGPDAADGAAAAFPARNQCHAVPHELTLPWRSSAPHLEIRRKYRSAIPAMPAPQDPLRLARLGARGGAICPPLCHRHGGASRCRWRCSTCCRRSWACSRRRSIPDSDLYAVNRPARLHLPRCGRQRGRPSRRDRRRAADAGARCRAYLPAAFIAMEDRRFYSHQRHRSARADRARCCATSRAGHVVAGGSTITQQTAKIVFTTQERTMSRKLDGTDRRGGAGEIALARSRSSNSISTASISAPAPMAWTARRMSISANRRAI